MRVHTCLCSLEQHDREEAVHCGNAVGSVAELNDVDITGSTLRPTANAESRSGVHSKTRWGSPPDLVPMLGRLRTLETVAS